MHYKTLTSHHDHLHQWLTHIWCKFLASSVMMYEKRKRYPQSLCYGFIFNLLVALCTVGFMCYFLYRFDSRLVSLERRLWEKQRDEHVTAGRKPAFLKQENHNKREHWKMTNEKKLEHSFLQRRVHEKARKKQKERLLKLSSWDASYHIVHKVSWYLIRGSVDGYIFTILPSMDNNAHHLSPLHLCTLDEAAWHTQEENSSLFVIRVVLMRQFVPDDFVNEYPRG